MPPSDRSKAERVPPITATPAPRYRALVGLNYPGPGRDEIRVEPDEEAVNLPAASVDQMLSDGDIEPWEAKEAREAELAAASAQAALDALDDPTEDAEIAALDVPVVAEDALDAPVDVPLDAPVDEPTSTTTSEEQ